MLTRVCPSLAFLVVMMMTPFAPRTPKIASDDGSFRISIDSMSSGLRKLILSLNSPSTTYNGLQPLMEFVPRIRISGSAPARPEFTICTPATFPCKEDNGFVAGLLAISSPLTLVIEPVKSLFFALPYPITTVSASTCESSFRVTLITLCAPTLTLCVVIPTQENTSTSSGVTEIEYLPSISVMVPVEVPCTSTDAPISGSLAASVTVPVTVFVCAKADTEVSNKQVSATMLLNLMVFF